MRAFLFSEARAWITQCTIPGGASNWEKRRHYDVTNVRDEDGRSVVCVSSLPLESYMKSAKPKAPVLTAPAPRCIHSNLIFASQSERLKLRADA
jgi:hypothetical protein